MGLTTDGKVLADLAHCDPLLVLLGFLDDLGASFFLKSGPSTSSISATVASSSSLSRLSWATHFFELFVAFFQFFNLVLFGWLLESPAVYAVSLLVHIFSASFGWCFLLQYRIFLAVPGCWLPLRILGPLVV